MVSNHQIGKAFGVPRGLLRFLVLKMISEKPMSGAEIAEQIEKQTDGRWKPSPGSLYPLLAWMLDKGLTKESPKGTEVLKRYTFTTKGSQFLTKQIALAEDFLHKLEFLLPLLIGGLQFGVNKAKLHGTIEPARQLIRSLLTIRNNLDRLSQSDTDDMAQALNDCSRKLEKLTLKFQAIGTSTSNSSKLNSQSSIW
jgi:DNA-binding PadR family transcriptional regulator